MGCTADTFYVFVAAVGEGEALEEIVTVLHSPDIDFRLVMTLRGYRPDLLLGSRLRLVRSNSLYKGDGGGCCGGDLGGC